MLYISKINDYLEILTDEEVKDFVAIHFSESIREAQNLRKINKSLYIFLTTPVEVKSNSSDNCVHYYNDEILNLFDPELQLINTKPVIKSKLKEFLSNLKRFELSQYLKRNYHKVFHSSTKLIASEIFRH